MNGGGTFFKKKAYICKKYILKTIYRTSRYTNHEKRIQNKLNNRRHGFWVNIAASGLDSDEIGGSRKFCIRVGLNFIKN